MKCIRCNRELKDPQSIERKIGETCAKKLGIVPEKTKKAKKIKHINNLYNQKYLFDFS